MGGLVRGCDRVNGMGVLSEPPSCHSGWLSPWGSELVQCRWMQRPSANTQSGTLVSSGKTAVCHNKSPPNLHSAHRRCAATAYRTLAIGQFHSLSVACLSLSLSLSASPFALHFSASISQLRLKDALQLTICIIIIAGSQTSQAHTNSLNHLNTRPSRSSKYLLHVYIAAVIITTQLLRHRKNPNPTEPCSGELSGAVISSARCQHRYSPAEYLCVGRPKLTTDYPRQELPNWFAQSSRTSPYLVSSATNPSLSSEQQPLQPSSNGPS